GQIVPGIPARLPLNAAFLIALVACALIYIFLWRTKWGYEIRATGANPSAAEYGGISVKKQIGFAMAVSGGLAGMVAINEGLGYRYRYYQGFSPQYGFTGIAVALLGRNHPVGVLVAALFFGALTRGGLFVDIFTEKVSKDLVLILQGLVILFVAAEALFQRRFGKKHSQAGYGECNQIFYSLFDGPTCNSPITRRTWRPHFGTIRRHQYCAGRPDAGRCLHRRRGDAFCRKPMDWPARRYGGGCFHRANPRIGVYPVRFGS